jgi:heptosyltransferase I
VSASVVARLPDRAPRIGVVMMSAVGDAVHVLPLLTALRAHAPDSRITWVLQPGAASLVRGHHAVDEIVEFDRARGWRAYRSIRAALATRPFDVVLALQVYFKAGLVTSFTRSSVKLGFDRARARDLNWLFTTHRIPAREGQHVQDQYFEFLDALDVPHGEPAWDLGPWPEERAWQAELLGRYDRPITPIVVATSKPEKDWMPERWAEVADALWNDFGLQPLLVGGRSPRERSAEAEIMRRARVPVASALGSGLRKLVGILDGAALVLSPDTGPLHMTVALGTPVISLMGYTNPKRVGPYRRFHDLMIDAYGDPGEAYPISMENRPGRMSRITVRDVLDRVERWRTSYAGASARSGPNG